MRYKIKRFPRSKIYLRKRKGIWGPCVSMEAEGGTSFNIQIHKRDKIEKQVKIAFSIVAIGLLNKHERKHSFDKVLQFCIAYHDELSSSGDLEIQMQTMQILDNFKIPKHLLSSDTITNAIAVSMIDRYE